MAGKSGKGNNEAEDGGFLSRWSERKRGTAPESAPEAAEQTEESAPEAAWSEEDIQAKLAEVEAMKPGDDFKPLLASALPEIVKRAALRKLWRSNPVFAILDGLNDYDLDYRIKPGVVENLRSAYQAGKGYVFNEEEESRRQAEISARRERDKQRDLDRTEEREQGGQDTASKAAESTSQPEPQEDAGQTGAATPTSSDDKGPEDVPDKPRGAAVARRWGGESA